MSDTAAQPENTAAQAFTRDQVSDALNRAADEILEAADAPDEGLRDAVNLVVNATLAYLEGTASNLQGVAEQSYAEPLETILGWISS